MKKEVIFVLIDGFADWESAFLAAALNGGVTLMQNSGELKYIAKTMSITKEPVCSIGGFQVIPDYDIDTMPADYAALVLIGGTGWNSEKVELLAPLVSKAIERKAVVGGICMGSVYLGMHGFLNEVRHTSNTLDFLKTMAGEHYTGEARYVEAQVVSDGGIVTSNGSGYLEFTKEILILLNADTLENIDAYYNFNKLGLCEFMKMQG
ncbi:MAG: glutamine amidotransferase [Paludibacteraceae bacterium]|nr:glutamine amidotransferase [Paludibacteraceae bacterium]